MSSCDERIQRIEQELSRQENKEAWILVRVMRETGIRLRDALELKPEHIYDNKVFMVEKKYAPRLYGDDKGQKPSLSPETAAMLVPGEDGKYFHITPERFNRLLRKICMEAGIKRV